MKTPGMGRTMVLRAGNLLLFLAFCMAAGTGLVLEYKLPPGSRGGKGLELLGADRHEWGEWHFWICLTALALVAIHLFLHRAWLVKVAGGARRWPVFGGLALGLALVLGPLLLPVRSRTHHRSPEPAQDSERSHRGTLPP